MRFMMKLLKFQKLKNMKNKKDGVKMKENCNKKGYKKSDNKTDILESISPKIKLLFEENEQNTDYLIPLDESNSVKLVKIQEK